MTDARFTESEAITGMCLWEAFMEVSRDNEAAAKLLGDHGSFTIRGALTDLIRPCDDGWAALEALNDEAPVFDWEWCPDFVKASLTNGLMASAIEQQYMPMPVEE